MRWIFAGLVCLLSLESAPLHGAQDAPVTGLNLVIVEGEGAINNVRQRTARAPIVQVEDQNHRPVAGAAVTFLLPQRGASGVFPNGSRSITVMTDSQGRAVANGIKPNNVAGEMRINVNASFQGLAASTVIVQTNALAAAGAAAGGVAAKSIALKVIIAVAVAGAAAATGAVIATRGGDTPATAVGLRPPVTVSPGTGTVGAPR